MVKRILLVVCIFLVCISFTRIALGVDKPINTQEIALQIANNSASYETIQDVTKRFSQLVSAVDTLEDVLKVNDLIDYLKEFEGENLAWEGLVQTLGRFFDFVSNIVSLIVASLCLGVVLIEYAIPILIGVLKDLLMILRIVMILLFGIGSPT